MLPEPSQKAGKPTSGNRPAFWELREAMELSVSGSKISKTLARSGVEMEEEGLECGVRFSFLFTLWEPCYPVPNK